VAGFQLTTEDSPDLHERKLTRKILVKLPFYVVHRQRIILRRDLDGTILQRAHLRNGLHAQQLRKGTNIPYISHLLAVTGIVLQHGGTEDEAIAALLHDAVEDQGGPPTLEEINRRFGHAVSEIVQVCTNADTVPKPEWRQRKERYIAHLSTASPSARLVCAADKLDNARSVLADCRQLGEALWGRFNGGRVGTLWYYRSVVDAIKKVDQTPLLEELSRVVSEIERLAEETARAKTAGWQNAICTNPNVFLNNPPLCTRTLAAPPMSMAAMGEGSIAIAFVHQVLQKT
jgi:(p)ppGpp synthase/HD superfamily hydrolase